MNKDIAIKVENLSKIYKLYNAPIDRMKEALHPRKKSYHKEFYALNDVSFEIKKGETVGIIGKNGSGKSTLLKIITGVLTPTSGRVTVNGRISALLELGAGFNPEYTGMENIYFQGNLMGFEREEMESKVQEILNFADIGDFIHQPVKNYSSGMFARLAFAVAINVEPEILIVDEALSVGDIAFQAKCAVKMDSMRQHGVTVLFVTHSLSEVKKVCNSAIYLKNGSIVTQGDTKTVCNQYETEIYGQINAKELLLKDLNDVTNNFTSYDLVINKFFEENKSISRAGSGEAEVINVDILVNGSVADSASIGDNLVIRIYVKYKQDIDTEGIIGYMIQDLKGRGIIGYNIWNSGKLLPVMKKNQILIFDFESVNILAPGDYTISLGVRKNYSPQNLEFMDFIQVAAKLTVAPLVDNYVAGIVYNKHICKYEIQDK